jgi:voltage-gated potassium channel
VIPTIVLEESGLVGGWQFLASAMNWVIWSVFAVEVVTMLIVTRHRRRWLGHHVLEVLIVLLTPPFLPAALQSTRALRLLRLFRVVLTARALRAFFSVNGLRFATVVALFGVLGAGALFATVEAGQHLSTWDGIWWAINQITTAGSEVTPHTTGGRVVAIAVLLVGVGYIAVLTGAMAQLFIRAMHAESDPNRELVKRIDGLSGEITSLRDEVRQLINEGHSR